MIKKVFWVMLCVLAVFLIYIFFQDDVDYLKKKNYIQDYVKTGYGENIKYIKGQKGNSPWNNARVDVFAFYDEVGDFYFEVKYSSGDIVTNYNESKHGKTVTETLLNLFDKSTSDNMLIRTLKYEESSDSTPYASTYSELILFVDKIIDYDYLYTIIKKIIDSFDGISIQLVVSDNVFKGEYVKYFNYESTKNLIDLPELCLININSEEFHISSGDELKTYVGNVKVLQ